MCVCTDAAERGRGEWDGRVVGRFFPWRSENGHLCVAEQHTTRMPAQGWLTPLAARPAQLAGWLWGDRSSCKWFACLPGQRK